MILVILNDAFLYSCVLCDLILKQGIQDNIGGLLSSRYEIKGKKGAGVVGLGYIKS